MLEAVPSRRTAVGAVLLFVAASVAAQVPSNNECTAPIVVTDGVNPSAPFGASATTFTNVLATNSANFGVSCGGATHFNKDVFFSYVATCTGTTTFSTCTPAGFAGGTLTDTVLDVYAASACPGGGAALACNDQFCGSLSEVSLATTAGQSYLIRVGSWSTSLSGTFYLSVRPAGPPNDECSGATPLFVGANAGSTDCATPSLGTSCTGFTTPVADVWHTFTPAANCILKVTMSGAGANRLGLYSGACGTAQTVHECDNLSAYDVQIVATAGTTYTVRVGRSVAPGADNTYSLVVDCAPLLGNDECTGAIPLSDGVNPSAPAGATGVAFSNVGATESVGFAATAACAGTGHPGTSDVFFSYTSSVDGNVRISLCTPAGFVPGSLSDSILEVYPSTACPFGGVAAIACNDQSCGSLSEVTFAATFGATYYVRVSAWDLSEGSFYATVDPVANDTCATAKPVGHGVTHGSTFGADATNPSPAVCIAPTIPDVWYSVTPATDCDLVVSATGAANRLALLTGTCGALTESACDAVGSLSVVLPNAAAGTTYYVQVAQTVAANAGPFTLTVSCQAPSNDDCSGAIAIFDGINPAPPDGSAALTFSNVGATTSGLFAAPGNCPGSSPGHPGQSDVFFTYVATCTGTTQISMCPVTPYPSATGLDTLLEVYAATDCPGGSTTPLACDDQGCGGPSKVLFAATAGVTYVVRVSSWNASETIEGAFRLEVDPDFCLFMDAPSGPGSLRIRNVSGPPNAVAVTVLTVFPGNYPAGLFFGIDPTFTEIVLQASAGTPPFVNVLDADGNSTFGPILGAPPLTLYGVSLALNAFGQIGDVTPPVAFTIP